MRKTKPVNILVIDVGGTHIKLRATTHDELLQIPSGPTMTGRKMVAAVKQATVGWKYNVITIGYPGPVLHERIAKNPHNLGPGWLGFNFEKAFGCPVNVLNDAAMQALGSYLGKRMLFLGLGTGLGSAMILDGLVAPMELAHLPYKNGRTYEEYVGLAGLKRLGTKAWLKHVNDILIRFKAAFEVDYIVIGGGDARLLKKLPRDTVRGDNANAFTGGCRIWAERSSYT